MYGTSALPDGWLEPELGPGGSATWRVLRGLRGRLLDRYQRSWTDPQAAQAEALARVLDAVRGTAFAREHGLDGVSTLDDYRGALAVRPMSDHEGWLRRAVAEGPGVLTRHPHLAYNRTSGTTGIPKDLPVTTPWAQTVAEAQQVWVTAMVAEHPSVAAVGARALNTVGRRVEATSRSGLPIGSNTGRMRGAQPWWIKLRYAVPARVFEIPDADLRQYVLLRLALAVDVRVWTTANPSTLLALCRAMTRWREPLSADLVDRTLTRGPAAALSPADRRALGPWLWRKRSLPQDWRPVAFWPNLRCINCWKGGAAPFFIERLPDAVGARLPVREVGVSASEGHIALPLHSSWWGGVVHVRGHLVELVPEGGGPAVLPHEADVGGIYRVALSTTAGLYRADLGDRVRVEGRYLNTPVIRFLGKVGDVISITGEKVTADQIAAAAARVLGPGVVGLAAVGRVAEQPRLQVLVEGPIPAGAALALDAELQRLNGEYASKRHSDRYQLPEITPASEGTFDRWRRHRTMEGAADGQIKDPIVVDLARFDQLAAGWRGSAE